MLFITRLLSRPADLCVTFMIPLQRDDPEVVRDIPSSVSHVAI